MKYLRRLICRLFGHKYIILFRPEGKHWCYSAGPFDNGCERCDWTDFEACAIGKDLYSSIEWVIHWNTLKKEGEGIPAGQLTLAIERLATEFRRARSYSARFPRLDGLVPLEPPPKVRPGMDGEI